MPPESTIIKAENLRQRGGDIVASKQKPWGGRRTMSFEIVVDVDELNPNAKPCGFSRDQLLHELSCVMGAFMLIRGVVDVSSNREGWE